MLKQRIITALILIPLVLWGILALPTTILASILGVIVLLGAWEWARLVGIQGLPGRVAFLLVTLASLWLGWKNL